MIRLIIERPEQPPTLVAFPQAVVVVGRGAAAGEAAPDWVLPVPDVSRRQCRVSVGGPEVFVGGLSERSGTYVNGQRIARVARLRAGDVVCFGRCSVRLAGEPAAKVGRKFHVRVSTRRSRSLRDTSTPVMRRAVNGRPRSRLAWSFSVVRAFVISGSCGEVAVLSE